MSSGLGSERERLGAIAYDGHVAHRNASGITCTPWNVLTEWEREGWCKVAEALGAPATPIRYRILKLNGYQDLGSCRVEEFEWAGTRMLRVTTLCKEPVEVLEILPTRIYESRVITETEALAMAHEATERRAAVARAEEERLQREAREQAMRREARANVTAAVTVVGAHVEVVVTDAGGGPRGDLLRRDDAEVIAALRAVEIEPYTARILYTENDLASRGLEITHEADRVEGIVAMLRGLGFGTVTRLPDQPARAEDTEDADVPF